MRVLPNKLHHDQSRPPFRAESWLGTDWAVDVYMLGSPYVLNVTLGIHGGTEALDYLVIRLQERRETRTVRRMEIRTRALLLGGAWSLWTGDLEQDVPTFWRTLEPYLPAISELEAWPSFR
jgi:hypothetical protein